jgi:hypothetical protein
MDKCNDCILSCPFLFKGYAGAYEVSDKEGVLVTLIVTESMRGKGIGRMLMEETRKRFAGRNAIIRSISDSFYIKDGRSSLPVDWEIVKGDVNTNGPDPTPTGTTFVGNEITISDFVEYERRAAGYNANRQIFIEEMSKTGRRYAAIFNGQITGVILARIIPRPPGRWWKADLRSGRP